MSSKLYGFANVELDSASAYAWDELNEADFLLLFFNHLREYLADDFLTYNFIIFSSHASNTFPSSAYQDTPNKVLIYISDETPSISLLLKLQPHYLCVFKSYLPRNLQNTNVFPFPLGYVKNTPHLEVKPVSKREYDVFFYGNLHRNRLPLYQASNSLAKLFPTQLVRAIVRILPSKLRQSTLDKLIHLPATNPRVRFTDGFKKGVSAEEYAHLLYNSKIALCPKGFHSPETFRHMEAMRAGTVVISEEIPETAFYKGSPIVVVPNWRAGLQKLEELLKKHELLADLQAKTIKWWEEVCSEKAAAKYVYDKVSALKSGSFAQQ